MGWESKFFKQSEFGCLPETSVESYNQLCVGMLDPIREKFGVTVITSGHRDPKKNSATGGVKKSQHTSTSEYCAADFQTREHKLQVVFDWIRLESGLLFDQVILERGKNGVVEIDDCIHISWVKTNPRRTALVGSTHGSGGYTRAEVK